MTPINPPIPIETHDPDGKRVSVNVVGKFVSPDGVVVTFLVERNGERWRIDPRNVIPL